MNLEHRQTWTIFRMNVSLPVKTFSEIFSSINWNEGMQKRGFKLLTNQDKRHFKIFGLSSFWWKVKRKIFLSEPSSNVDILIEIFVREKLALRDGYHLENRDNSAPITQFCFSDYQYFHSNINVNEYLKDSFFLECLCGTLIEVIRRPLTEKGDSEWRDDSKILARLGNSEVSGFWWKQTSKV